jgi:hypothetical protein
MFWVRLHLAVYLQQSLLQLSCHESQLETSGLKHSVKQLIHFDDEGIRDQAVDLI